MKTTNMKWALLATIAASQVSLLYAQEKSVLDPSQHPSSPVYSSAFPETILPLDTKLSWKKRFKGNEEFNENEVLPKSASMTGHAEGAHKVHTESGSGMMSKMDATGMIKQIKASQGKIKIQHEPIERLGMPAMTMLFKVEDTSQLEGLEKGQEVSFSVDNTSGGFVITQISSQRASSAGSDTGALSADAQMDARGEVKSIRASQGKIKIQHGPIDKLGMPAMTMMFKVEDPSQLDGLEKGGTVDFSVENTASGFVITDIKPAR